MERNRLIYKLKEFYSLESYQADLYQSQINSSNDEHINKIFERFSIREQEHVNYYKSRLQAMGESATLVGTAFTAAGFLTGKAAALLDQKKSFQLGSAVEKKATEMYYGFIQEARSNSELNDLVQTLWYFLADEETHQFWFAANESCLANEKTAAPQASH